MEDNKKSEKVALFIDLENFIGFSQDLRLPFELEPILKKLTETTGKVLFRRSFGDLTQALFAIHRTESIRHVRQMMQRNLVQHEDVLYDNRYKNSSDIRLAVEALSIAFSHPEITTFALVSADRDYIPLFSKLRELGRNVIGFSGNQATVSDRYRDACDAVFYVEDLYKTQTGFLTEIAPQQTVVDFETLRPQYLDLLKRAIVSLNGQDRKTVGGIIAVQMRRMQSDFDTSRAGFDSFQEFIHYAKEKGMINCEKQGGDVMVWLPNSNGNGAPAKIEQTAAPENAARDLTAVYRRFMETKLRQPLPTREVRERIYESAHRQINYNDYISLGDLSHDATEDLVEKDFQIEQPVVYKLLYTLHRAGCFAVEDGYDSYDPRILGARFPVETWDEKFVTNALSLMQREMKYTAFIAQNLSELFYESADNAKSIEDKLKKLQAEYSSR